MQTTLENVARGTAMWGDFDNDGDLDLLFLGSSGGTAYSHFYCTLGKDRFELFASDLPGASVVRNEGAVLDYDGDPDLLTGEAVVRNDLNLPNWIPTAPGGLTRVMGENRVALSWSASTRAETPRTCLRYLVRIGTQPGAADVLSPTALPPHANPGGGRSLAVVNLVEGQTYFWSAQAVDSAGQRGRSRPKQPSAPEP